jgi:hypothetical protein
MIRKMLVAAASLMLIASPLAFADDKEDVVKAAKKLSESGYSWKSTTEGGFGGQQEGKAQKDGLTWVSLAMRDNTVEILKQGDKAAVKTEDGRKAASDAGEGQGRFLAMMAQNFRAPAAQALDMAEKVKEVKKSGDAYETTLTEEQAKALMSLRGRGGEGQAPQISNAKGSAKFWVKDGALSKFEYKVQGTRTRNNEDQEINRTTTVEFKDVGTAKVDAPSEAKDKLK